MAEPPEVERRVSPDCVIGAHHKCEGTFWDEKFSIHNTCRCQHHERRTMAATPQQITVVVEQITDRQMRARLAQAKADALIEFADSLPDPWGQLRFHRFATGVPSGLADLLRERAEAIIEEANHG